ncbi:MAG: hypothetical protein U5N85_01850 [Arcicella sp.]|nr:hypothetical protein [Arcicella sp.]
MLTFEINDAQLEHRILEKARAIGKSTQELLKEILSNAIQEDITLEKLPFEVPKLDYRNHSSIYNPELSEEEEEYLLTQDASVMPFAHVSDTVEFANQLRKTAWQRK